MNVGYVTCFSGLALLLYLGFLETYIQTINDNSIQPFWNCFVVEIPLRRGPSLLILLPFGSRPTILGRAGCE